MLHLVEIIIVFHKELVAQRRALYERLLLTLIKALHPATQNYHTLKSSEPCISQHKLGG